MLKGPVGLGGCQTLGSETRTDGVSTDMAGSGGCQISKSVTRIDGQTDVEVGSVGCREFEFVKVGANDRLTDCYNNRCSGRRRTLAS